MKTPWLIQRCELGDGRLRYDYMGSTEFEIGGQPESLKRIFAKGIRWGSATISVGGNEVVVHMVAADGFLFDEYQPYLQQLADHALRLKEWTNFDDVAKAQAGIETNRRYTPSANAWFDFENDVLWVLDKNKRKALVAVLEEIKKKWSEK
jgi:uncharacterized tellurite resistance protein B-like protein